MEQKKGDSSHGDARSQRDFGDSARTARPRADPSFRKRRERMGHPAWLRPIPHGVPVRQGLRMPSMTAVGRS